MAAKKKEKSGQLGVYEGMFLMGPSAQADNEAALGLCRKVIESHGGQIIVLKKWDERKLAFEVGGQKRGTYIIAYFRAPGTSITAMERDVKLSEEILRGMFTKADHLSEQEMAAVEPQPIQAPPPREERPWERDERSERGSRNDRGPRDDREGGERREGAAPRAPRPAKREEVPAEAAKE